ncbi:HDOD domain-containing protein [Shewanella schlegeliana]|uniref:HDOD domain-containing protein n=1 Tax=Shewanella schlegeliana TaxID=190308 RepID=A0ABS1SZY9_9GAMM|nr:HDOD domain-containing protein [Shewanella schlegeliana]MBL4914092.1 HDOD domain-containing protein [Shewanella schlegeliana]MCL1110871.1 HDOD domain-containing protein [Shewanella schlegeliana]GIU34663.1 signal transduction protein with HDOD/GAF domains [Shewanella schlegeliana]
MKATNFENNKFKGVEYWTNRISDQEMPALCSTVKTLEKLAKDDVSSLSILGKSVMHDNALTSRILRVANSVTYSKGISQVTTVSRAAVVLGFDTIKNICITAKLLSSLLEAEGLSENVYKRMLKLMAQAFLAAMLTKTLLKDYDEELQEEVFIASLLYHLGESAFWSTGCAETLVLDSKLSRCDTVAESNKAIRDVLGASFEQLSVGLARNWGLGCLLIKSLSLPDERTPEVRSIFLANKLSELLCQDSPNMAELSKRLKQTSDMLGIEVDVLKGRMLRCHKATKTMADAYGARILLEYLPSPKHLNEKFVEQGTETVIYAPNVNRQLECLRELTQCALNREDFNQVLSIALKGILTGVGVDRCCVMLLSPNRKSLQPRIVLGDDAEKVKASFNIRLENCQNVFQDCISLKEALFVDNPHSAKWRFYMDDNVKTITGATGFMLAPLIMDHTVIGVIYADRDSSGRRLMTEDFANFTHVANMANVCFSAVAK